MTKEEIAKLTINDIPSLFGPFINDLDDPSFNPNKLTEEDTAAIINHLRSSIRGSLYIDELRIQDQGRHVAPSGEKKQLTIIGSPGAGFTITVKDSSDCSIMEDEIENVEIPSNGKYVFTQEFPSIISGLKREYYEIVLTPHAGVKRGPAVGDKVTLYQYKKPNITVTAPISSIQGVVPTARTASGTDSTLSSSPTSKISGGGRKERELITTVAESEATPGLYYIKSLDFQEAASKSTVVKKIVNRRGDDPRGGVLNLKPLTVRTVDDVTSGDLAVGMTIKGKVSEIKMVISSLDVPNCKKKTNKFELNNTVGLFEGMFVYINNVLVAEVLSVDCNKNITISKKLVIKEKTKVLFRFTVGARVSSVITQLNAEGEACVTVDRAAYIPDGIELEFDDDTSSVIASIVGSGSGTSLITLTKKVQVLEYGIKDVVYTLDLTKMITRKPNIRDFSVNVGKDSAGITINLSDGDGDANKLTKVHAITKNASHGTSTYTAYAGGGIKYPNISYVPKTGFVGEDTIKYRITFSDPESALVDDDTATNPMSDEKTITITVK